MRDRATRGATRDEDTTTIREGQRAEASGVNRHGASGINQDARRRTGE